MLSPKPHAEEKLKYCMYCLTFRAPDGFKFRHDLRSGTKRGMCSFCQEKRTRSRKELMLLAEREQDERKAAKKNIIRGVDIE